MKTKKLLGKVLLTAFTLGVVAYFGVNIASYFEDPLATTFTYTYRRALPIAMMKTLRPPKLFDKTFDYTFD